MRVICGGAAVRFFYNQRTAGYNPLFVVTSLLPLRGVTSDAGYPCLNAADWIPVVCGTRDGLGDIFLGGEL